ncbi:glycosyltransferase family protein [Jatrophihabitans fulvus]
MSSWQPVRIGLRRTAQPLVPAELTLLGPSRASELRIEALGSLGLRRRLVAFLRSRGVSVLHAHFGLDAIAARPVAAALGIPLVVTCHGYDVTLLPRRRVVGREYRRRLRATFAAAGARVAVSRFVADRMTALGATDVRVLPIGIDTSLTARADGPRRGVAFVGRLVPKKGVPDLLEAWAGLPADLRAAHPLRIAGDGPLRAELTARAAAVDGPVEVLGPQTSRQVAELLARSAAYAQPSHTSPAGDAEGFGMVFLEAARAGLPSVAYAHGGVVDAVVDGTTGLLAPEGDLAGLRQRLQQVLTDDALASRLGAAGRERVLREFDVRDCTARLEALYDEVSGRS